MAKPPTQSRPPSRPPGRICRSGGRVGLAVALLMAGAAAPGLRAQAPPAGEAPFVSAAPHNGGIVLDLLAAVAGLDALISQRVDRALGRGCGLGRGPFLAVRGPLATVTAEGPALARRMAAFRERASQDNWQALGGRMRTWAGRLRDAHVRLSPDEGPAHRNPFGLVVRRMDPRDFIYQDARRVLAEVPSGDLERLRQAALDSAAAARAALARLDALRSRCAW